jgi:nicotinate phosphoribosyltransferase
VYRRLGNGGYLQEDILTIEGDTQEGEPLLLPVMQSGRRIRPGLSLEEARQYAAGSLAQLPARLRQLDAGAPFEAQVAGALKELTLTVDRQRG